MLIHCGCDRKEGKQSQGAAFQDGVYGVGVRVHNPTSKEGTYRCTVCGREQTRNSKQKEKEKELEKEKAKEKTGKGKKK